jgi:hypothetical protein
MKVLKVVKGQVEASSGQLLAVFFSVVTLCSFA